MLLRQEFDVEQGICLACERDAAQLQAEGVIFGRLCLLEKYCTCIQTHSAILTNRCFIFPLFRTGSTSTASQTSARQAACSVSV